MKKRLHRLIPVLAAIALLGCERNFDFDGEELHPKMAINSIIDARSDTNLIKISESVFDFSNQQPCVVENPKIQLSINGTACNQMWLDTIIGVHSYYKFVSQLSPGDKVEFSAHTQKHGTVKGYDIVPEAVDGIKNIEHSWFWKDGVQYLRLYVTFADNTEERNFYRIIVKTNATLVHPYIQEPDNIWTLHEVFTGDEILFNKPGETDEAGKESNYYRIFDNEMFRGKEYTLNIFIKWENYTVYGRNDYVRQRVKAEIRSLSEKLYRNMRSQELALGTMGDVFSEPVKLYSNMQGGYGILGIYSAAEKVKTVAEKGE